MYLDRFDHIEEYFDKVPHLKEGVEFIRSNTDTSEGKHFFDGGYVMYQDPITRGFDEGGYEAHRKYIDVQIMKEGREAYKWNRIENLEETIPYREERDRTDYEGPGSLIELIPGMFMILMPFDAHKAARHFDGEEPHQIHKIMIKLEVE